MHRALPAVLLLALAACSSSSAPVSSSTTPTTSAPAVAPPSPTPGSPSVAVAPAPDLRLTSVSCGFGGSATAVSTLVDVEAGSDVHGITATFTMREPSGTGIGHERAPVMLLVSPPGRGANDFSTQGTSPFSGDLAAGQRTRLQVFAGLDGNAPMGPAIIETTLHAADGRTWSVSCTAPSMWPSS